MEEGAGDAGGDGDQVALAGEDFDQAGAGEFGEVDGASAADAGDGGFVGGDGGKVGQELARVNEEDFERIKVPIFSQGVREGRDPRNTRFLHSACLSLRERHVPVGMTSFWMTELGDFFQRMGVVEGEFGDRGAAKRFQMRSAGQFPSHVVGDRAHVGSGGDTGAESGAVDGDFEDFEFLNFNLDWLQLDLFLLAGEFVGGDAFDFLCGEWRRSLLDESAEANCDGFDFFARAG